MSYTRSLLALFCLLCAGMVACRGESSGGVQPGGAGTPPRGAPATGGTLVNAVAPAKGGASAGAGTQPSGGGVTTGAAATSASTSGTRTGAGNLPALTLHLAGDSTVMTYVTSATAVQEGWGQELGQFFNDQVKINNQALGGASVKTFQSGRWSGIITALKPGDYVMIQFGANDSGTVAGRHVEPGDYAAALGQMADEAKARQATPIFVTPSAFYQWSGGKQDNARLAPYAAACYTAGTAKNVLVDDLNARGVEWLSALGQTAATEHYMLATGGGRDKAHFVKSGAVKMAQFVAEELRRINSPLAAYLK